MYKYFDNKLKKTAINLAPGEFFVSGEDIVLNTVLGSCVAVALYDPRMKIAGLNHFMLSESRINKTPDNFFKIERYGLYAMEAVINSLLKLGGQKSRFQAKIFGGSAVLKTSATSDIGADNIRFAEEYLATERIPILNRDTGGTLARRIYLYPQTFKVLLRHVKPGDDYKRLMDNYKEKLEREKAKRGDIILF